MLEQPGSTAQVAQLVEQGTENPFLSSDAALRFLSKIDRSAGPDACHPWTADVTGDGYGIWRWKRGKGLIASKLAMEIFLGRRLGPGEVTRHGDNCTTRRCCNVRHLSVGTQADNIGDAVRLGRVQHGERHYRSRLTAEQVAEIKRLCSTGAPHAQLARRFGVGQRAISHIANGTNWRRVAPAVTP